MSFTRLLGRYADVYIIVPSLRDRRMQQGSWEIRCVHFQITTVQGTYVLR